MKKLVFMFAAFAAISFASCGGNVTSEQAVDSTAVDSLDTVEVVDSVVADTVITAE
jgi:hypothetical protein